MQRELKVMQLQSCWLEGNHLSVRIIGEKGFSLLGSTKIGLRSNGERSCGLVGPDIACSRVTSASGEEKQQIYLSMCSGLCSSMFLCLNYQHEEERMPLV